MSSAIALLEEPVRDLRRSPAEFGLAVAGFRISVPRDSVREIAEAGPLHRLPLAASPVIGLSDVEGRPTVCIDTARLIGRPTDEARFLVVVATRSGDIALTAGQTFGEGGGETLDLGKALPWTGGFAPSCRTAAAKPAARPVSLMLVQAGDRVVALRSERLERVERGQPMGSLSDGPPSRGHSPGENGPLDCLVSVGEALVAGRALDPSALRAGTYALILRGDEGERIALLTESAFGVERCEPRRLALVRHPDGGRSLWWNSQDRGPVRVIDPATLFGWQPQPLPGVEEDTATGAGRGERPDQLFIELSGATLSIPLSLVEGVEETPPPASSRRDGRPLYDLRRIDGEPSRPPASWLRLKGVEGLLGVDRILPLGTPGISWQPLGGLPPEIAGLFDSAGWHPERKCWILRLKQGTALSDGLRLPARAFARARTGWAAFR